MASKSQPDRLTPRLYVVTPPVAEAAAWASELAGALAHANVAAVLMRLASADERTLINCVKALVPAIQDAGTALLLDGHVDLVGRTGADGAHLADGTALKDALPRLKPERIAGAGGLISRHDAMVAAESGADYVMFGEPDAHGTRPAFAAILDRVGWWSEVFEIPCVAYAGSLDEVGALAAAGADFIALAPFVFDDRRGLAAALADAVARLDAGVPA